MTLARIDKEKITEGLWSHNASLWSHNPEVRNKIGQRLGWLHVIETMMGEQERLKEFADDISSLGFTTTVLLGMGGSSLASEVFASCYGATAGHLKLKVLDTTVPASILSAERDLDLQRTLFIVSSKSGGTTEVISLYKYFRSRMEQVAGEQAGKHFVAITDPGTSLGKLASEQGFRRVFLNPSDIGGRFSALSYFGLVPAALIGTNIERLLMRAAQAVEASGPEVPSLESPGTWLGVITSEAALAGRDKLTLVISPKLASFGGWLEQLVAESTGKEGKGILPIDAESLGPPRVYGDDRVFIYLRLDGDTTYDEQISTLEKAGQPVITQRLHSAYDLSREMFRWEFATAIAGAILNINPFDEPNVQESKDNTSALLEVYKKEGQLPEIDRIGPRDSAFPGQLGQFAQSLRSGDYLAFNAFIPPTPSTVELLNALRLTCRDRFRVATTVGFGPRYLHSTGQIHKGGKDNGAFLLITMDDPEDLPIPGEPYSFGVLKKAQSLGDYQALKKRGRRAMRVHLKDESDLALLLDLVNVL
jgi:glucose-6-phosphate isomerase